MPGCPRPRVDAGCRGLRASLVFVLRVCACVPTTTIYPQTQSFLFLVSRGSGRRESGRGRKGVGREGPGSSAQAPVSSQGQVPPAARLPREEQDSPRQAAAGAAGAGSLGLVQPPGTWESVRVTAPGAQAARRRSPGQQGVLEPGPVPTAAFLPPRESVLGAPLTVHFRPPGAQPGIPLPRPWHLEGRGSRDEGTPPLRWTPPSQLKRPAAVR